jgi:hypothetical protein
LWRIEIQLFRKNALRWFPILFRNLLNNDNMGSIKIGAIPENLLLSLNDCAGIRFFSAKVICRNPATNEMEPYDTVIAIGFNAQNENLIDGPIRWDNVPCPPECHYSGGVSGVQTNPDVAIDMEAVQDARPETVFAAQFAKQDMQTLLGLVGLAKMRVYYTQTGTFLLQGADSNGTAIVNVYGLGDESDSAELNLWG